MQSLKKLTVNLDNLPAYVALIQRGGYRTTSGGKAFGVLRQTFQGWLDYGARDIQRGDMDSPYAQILLATEQAEQVHQDNAHAILDSSDDWRSVAWRLERRYVDSHGAKQAVTVTPALPTATEETVSALDASELRQLAQLAFEDVDAAGGTK